MRPLRMRPITGVWNAGSEVRLTRVADPYDATSAAGPRLRVEARFGARLNLNSRVDFDRSDLDLMAMSPRGFVIDLPIPEGSSED